MSKVTRTLPTGARVRYSSTSSHAAQPATRTTVYDIITERIIEQLEQGTVPWRKPWTTGTARNLVSKKAYRGVNVFVLASAPFASPFWLTFKQAKELGGSVKAGEKGYPVIFWSFPTEEQKAEALANGRERGPIVRYYTVFNVEQCDGIEAPADMTPTLSDAERIAEAERIVAEMPNRPATEPSGSAWYRASTDTVGMPPFSSFDKPESFYSTLFHELAHATGHASRLGRDGIAEVTHFGSTTYAKEELVAEMGAAMLCGAIGIEAVTIEQNAAYVANWLTKLRNDHRLVVVAAAQAQKAADYIRGTTFGEVAE